MTKKILYLIAISFIIGCSKSNNEEPIGAYTEKEGFTQQYVYEQTGCKPIDAGLITSLKLFVDSTNNYRYLYGSKTNDSKNCFWVSKFTPQGEFIWEKIDNSNANYNSRAYNPNFLNNGNIVMGKVLYENDYDIYAKEVIPVIIDVKTGNSTLIKIYDGYKFSDIKIYDNFFFCYPNDKELDVDPNCALYYVQIDNNGKILAQNNKMNIPKNYAIWKDNNCFISVDTTLVYMQNIISDEVKWKFIPLLPSFTTCQENAQIDNDSVTVNYNLKTADNESKTIAYRLSLETGEPQKDSEDGDSLTYANIYLKFGIPYKSPDSLTVTVDTIEVTNNGAGTLYYTIKYNLKNNTKDMVVNEGVFGAAYNTNVAGATESGFFQKMYPGESINRQYTFKSVISSPYAYLFYNHRLWTTGDSSVPKYCLKWKINFQ